MVYMHIRDYDKLGTHAAGALCDEKYYCESNDRWLEIVFERGHGCMVTIRELVIKTKSNTKSDKPR